MEQGEAPVEQPQSQSPSNNAQSQAPSHKQSTEVQQKEEDLKSVFVQSVDYGTTNQELEIIFEDCGKVVRVTILKDKMTGKPKGCAYVEFDDTESVEHALMLSGTMLRKRAIKVSHKRTNIRGMTNKNMSNEFLLSKMMSSIQKGRGGF